MGRSTLVLLTLVVAIAVFFSSGVCANSLGVPDWEYDALVALYNSTDGGNWINNTNWLTGNPNWYGVTVQFAHVTSLVLWSNNLAGAMPAGLGNLTKLHELNLGANRVTGPIPAGIGNMTSLWTCDLSRNALTGEIPSSITGLTALVWADLSYNALSCSDPAVLSFLATVDCCWQNTQTVRPTGVTAWRGGSGSAMVSWTPIAYNSDPGYYEVGYSYTSGGPYTFDPANRTEDKGWESAWVNGLDPNQPVYFVVRTVTLPHYNNQSTLTSLNSMQVASEVLPQGSKLVADGTSVWSDDVIITATFPDCCYVENEDRTWGIRVESPYGGYPDPGTRAEAFGIIRTNEDGERYLEVIDGYITGTAEIAPLGMTNRALGGGDWNYDADTGAGQIGVTGGTGLNNIGLLVRTTGACTYVNDHTFTIDDGSGVGVTCVTPPTILASPAWQQVAVTGASSIKKTDETYSRVLRVTSVNPITSALPEGVTGRWEMTSTSGDLAGVFGMLLVQQGSVVTGSARGCTITNGQISGNVFTGTFLVAGYDMTVAFSLTLDGETLTGTWAETGGEWSFPVTFHRVSTDPVSPYVGRPKVLSATCNGWSINVTWDRPINGWDYDIVDDNGHSIANAWDLVRSYDPATHVYHIALDPSTPFVPGAHYTIYLESGLGEEDPVDWYDPYGVPAWDWADECYSFDFTYQTLPPTPGFIMGYRTPGVPVQSVTITASWPQGYGLKLYQSADRAFWFPTTVTPNPRGANGDFTFQLSSNAYFCVTAVGAGVESRPSAIVHARPSEAETSGIVVDTPTEGATGVPLAPLISWHPAWSQSVTLMRYGVKVTDTAGNVMWSPLTSATPPQTSLIYGQTNGILGMPAVTPLATGTAYTIRLVAVDSENWQFAMSPGRHFTTTTTSGGQEEEDAIRALYESIKTAIEAHDINATMALFSQDYLHSGTDRAALQSDIAEGVSHVIAFTYDITNISITGNKASVTASITVTFDNEPPISWTEPSSGDNGLGMGWLIQENGQWLVYGNQVRAEVDVSSIREPDGTYTFRVMARGIGLTSATVSGPGIEPTALHWDSTWSNFNGSITPTPAPQVGYVYTFDLYYGDGRHETLADTITSFVPVGPTLTAIVQPDNTIAFTWDDVTAQVPGASYYRFNIQGQNGNGYAWSSSDLSLTTTSLTSEALQPGVTYYCGLCLYNTYGDGAEYAVLITIP